MGDKQCLAGVVAPAGFRFFFQLIPAVLVSKCPWQTEAAGVCPVLLWGGAAAAAGSGEGKQESLIGHGTLL